MVDNRNDRDANGFGWEEPLEGRLDGQVSPFDERVTPFDRAEVSRGGVSGVWAGLVAGAAMGLAVMTAYWVQGFGFWEPMKAIAVSVIGPAALIGGTAAVLIGIIIQLAMSAVLGLVFGALFTALVGRATEGTVAAAGLVYGLIVWIVAQFVVLPIVFPLIAVTLVPWVFGMAHVVYGVVLGLVPGAYTETPTV